MAYYSDAGEAAVSLNVAHLENFVLIAEQGSLSRAATIAGTAQPALGRQIQKLEAECGCRLFYRHGRGVALTAEGERYVERIRPLIRQLKSASRDLRESAREIEGNVIVGITPTVLEILGLPMLDRIEREYPRISLNVISGYSGYVHEWLVDGRLNIAVLHDAKRSRHISFDPLAEADLFLVSAPKSLSSAERKRKTVAFAEIAHYRMALPTRNHGLRRTLEFAAGEAGIRLDAHYEIDTLPLMKELVVLARAHSVLAMPAVLQEVQRSELIARKITPALSTSLGLATATSRPITKAIQVVLALVRSEMKAVVNASRADLAIKVF